MQNFKMDSSLLKDTTILIVGASRGIGRQVAKAYAKAGATVILLARSIKQLEKVYDEIEEASGPTPALYPFNLATATPKEYETLSQTLDKHFGALSGIVLNAAMLGSLTPIEHYPIAQWYNVMQVNLNSHFLLIHYLLPLLKKAPRASIIFTGTDAKRREAKAYWGAYAVSKGGILSLMQLLADELETNTNVRVNSINPGRVNSPLFLEAYPGLNPQSLPSSESLLSLYLYLMSDESANITGKTFELEKEYADEYE